MPDVAGPTTPETPRDGLRYSDGPSVEVQIEVGATQEAVFEAISDINLPARFSSEFLGAQWLDGATAAALGARFSGRNSHPAIGEWETTGTITAYEAPKVFEYTVGGLDGEVSSRWRFSIEPTPTGCVLTQFMQMGPGRSGINLAIDAMPDKESRILTRRLGEHRVNMEATLAGVKALVEAHPL